MVNIKDNKFSKQILAWFVLFIIVWFFGTVFLNAASEAGKRPSDKLTPKKEESASTPATTPDALKTIGKLEVLEQGLNLRSEPKKSDANVIKILSKGETLQIISSNEGWYKVASGKQQGYVTSSPRYVKVLDLKK